MRRLLSIFFCFALLALATESDVETHLASEIQTARQNLNQTLLQRQQEKSNLLLEIQDVKQKSREATAKQAKETSSAKKLEERISAAEQELKKWKEVLQRTESLVKDFDAGEPVLTAKSWNDDKAKPTLEGLLQLLEKGFATAGKPYFKNGEAVDEKGFVHSGRFAVFGPALFFQSDDGACCGPAVLKPNRGLPVVITHLNRREQQELEKLFKGELALPPTDVTMGKALELRSSESSFLQHLAKGGPIMIPIALLGVISLVIGIAKIVQLLSNTPSGAPLEVVERMVEAALAGKEQEAQVIAEGLHRSIRPLALSAFQNREMDEEHLEARLYEASLAVQAPLERWLGVLSVSAAAAPLLGLLGTVTGMIHTFRLITMFGTGDARLLSGGISEALVTTEAGLMVAIPALLIHAWCVRRVRRSAALHKQTALRLLRLAKSSGR